MSHDFENYGERSPSEAAKLLREWSEIHEDGNYHEWVVPLLKLADRIESITYPIQCFVMRSECLFATSLAEFFIDPRLEDTI